MNQQTLVAVYDTDTHADAAIRDLTASGVSSEAISKHAKSAGTSATDTATAEHEQGFWGKLFGTAPEHDAKAYGRSLESGATVVSVWVLGDQADKVSAILEKHNPIGLDEHAGQDSSSTTTTRTTTASENPGTAAAGGDTMHLAEESLAVGKRAVIGGRTIEMTETNEEAVVSKTARVVEDVALRKDVRDRTETVKDTLRRDGLEVEQVPAGRTGRSGSVAPQPPGQRVSKI